MKRRWDTIVIALRTCYIKPERYTQIFQLCPGGFAHFVHHWQVQPFIRLVFFHVHTMKLFNPISSSSSKLDSLLCCSCFLALLLSTISTTTSAAPIIRIAGQSGLQQKVSLRSMSPRPVRREFVAIHRDDDGSIRLAPHTVRRDGLYSTYNETHAEFHGDWDDPLSIGDDDMQRRSFAESPHSISSRQLFDYTCETQCGSKSASENDITAAEAALDAQFAAPLSWGVGTSIGTNGSIFQVANNIYAYGCDLGGKGQTTTHEEYAFQAQCLAEACGSLNGLNRDKRTQTVFGRDVGGFTCHI
ncbi:hypothetical protein C8R42DRAFT_468967 [Lentinula raphanica]|nr:hypothetical protein C8R42DRAFT_468967 [Lentinula raphanica]